MTPNSMASYVSGPQELLIICNFVSRHENRDDMIINTSITTPTSTTITKHQKPTRLIYQTR
jgi:hypothetical protein